MTHGPWPMAHDGRGWCLPSNRYLDVSITLSMLSMLSKIIRQGAKLPQHRPFMQRACNVPGLVFGVQDTAVAPACQVSCEGLKFPVLVHRFDSPLKLFAQRLRKKLFDWNSKLFGKDHREAWVDIILSQALR